MSGLEPGLCWPTWTEPKVVPTEQTDGVGEGGNRSDAAPQKWRMSRLIKEKDNYKIFAA